MLNEVLIFIARNSTRISPTRNSIQALKLGYVTKLNSHVASAIAANQMQQVAVVVIVTVIKVVVRNLFHSQNSMVVHHRLNE